jgi:hypothetical protein
MDEDRRNRPEPELIIDDPYESPGDLGAGIPDPSMRPDGDEVYVAARRRRQVTVVLYTVSAAFSLIQIVIVIMIGDSAGENPIGELSGDQDVWGGLNVIDAFIEMAAMIMLSVWSYRAYRNLTALSGEPLRFTPGWVVGYWYIPVLSLFRPVQAMNDVWRLSSPEQSQPSIWSTPAFIIVWWLCWLLAGIIGIIGGWVMEFEWGARMAAVAFNIVPAVLTALLVRYLGALQDAKANALGLPIY